MNTIVDINAIVEELDNELTELIANLEEKDGVVRLYRYITKPFSNAERIVIERCDTNFSRMIGVTLRDTVMDYYVKIPLIKSCLENGEISEITYYEMIRELTLYDLKSEAKYRKYLPLLIRIERQTDKQMIDYQWFIENRAKLEELVIERIPSYESEVKEKNGDSSISEVVSSEDTDEEDDDVYMTTNLYVIGVKRDGDECCKLFLDSDYFTELDFNSVFYNHYKIFTFFTVREAYDKWAYIKNHYICFIERPVQKNPKSGSIVLRHEF